MQQWSSKCGKIHWRVVLVSAAASNKSTTRPPLPPPACGGEWKEIDRNRWVGIGQFNRTANKGKRNNNDTDKEKIYKTNPQNRPAFSDGTATEPSRAVSEFPPPCPPHRNPAWWHMVWNTLLCLARFGLGQPGCAPSWSPVKINPVLAKPRTLSTPYSIPSTSRIGPPLSSWSPPLLLSPDIIPLVYGSSL